ncbi:MAG: DUF3842 family protein [Eubacteriales bacterium]|nr:DUF3842 family protein [Eubacteriales bacterium]
MNVLVIDGQGGGMGRALVTAIRQIAPSLSLIALGTNATATAAMLRAGAQQGATGENAICCQCRKADVIVGVVGILHANALLGEISPAIASAVSESDAEKVLIPLDRCGLHIIGVAKQPLETMIAEAAETVARLAGAR